MNVDGYLVTLHAEYYIWSRLDKQVYTLKLSALEY